MKRSLLSIILSLGALLTAQVYAAPAAAVASPAAVTPRIAVIDINKLFQNSKEVKTVTDKLRGEFKPRRDAIVESQKHLEESITKLKRDEAILTSTEKTKLQEAIVRDKRELERKEQDYQQDLAMTQNKEMSKIFEKIKAAITSFASREHYDMVLNKQAAPYVSGKLDVTEQIIKEMANS